MLLENPEQKGAPVGAIFLPRNVHIPELDHQPIGQTFFEESKMFFLMHDDLLQNDEQFQQNSWLIWQNIEKDEDDNIVKVVTLYGSKNANGFVWSLRVNQNGINHLTDIHSDQSHELKVFIADSDTAGRQTEVSLASADDSLTAQMQTMAILKNPVFSSQVTSLRKNRQTTFDTGFANAQNEFSVEMASIGERYRFLQKPRSEYTDSDQKRKAEENHYRDMAIDRYLKRINSINRAKNKAGFLAMKALMMIKNS
ncbi:MAG: hypothetical protein AAB459_02005 [Patescibacteria group bacterium]